MIAAGGLGDLCRVLVAEGYRVIGPVVQDGAIVLRELASAAELPFGWGVRLGYRNRFDVLPGLGPGGYAQTITTLPDTQQAALAWAKFLDDPGPVVIGATQGASCSGAACESLFNTDLWKSRHGYVRLP